MWQHCRPPNKHASLLVILVDIVLTSILIHFCSPSKFKNVKIMKNILRRQDSEVTNIVEVQESGKLGDHEGIME